jgi:hypothetical protein
VSENTQIQPAIGHLITATPKRTKANVSKNRRKKQDLRILKPREGIVAVSTCIPTWARCLGRGGGNYSVGSRRKKDQSKDTELSISVNISRICPRKRWEAGRRKKRGRKHASRLRNMKKKMLT